MAWRGYAVADKAMSQPNEAWQDAEKLKSYGLDSALSKSQVYYWIASMNDFNSSSISDADETSDNGISGACDNNEGCAKLGLVGLCCPTATGMYLGCCV